MGMNDNDDDEHDRRAVCQACRVPSVPCAKRAVCRAMRAIHTFPDEQHTVIVPRGGNAGAYAHVVRGRLAAASVSASVSDLAADPAAVALRCFRDALLAS